VHEGDTEPAAGRAVRRRQREDSGTTVG
jgi:hypothetical protein